MPIYQAIETRYLAPTNTQGSRIVATTPYGKRKVHHWDYSLNPEQNHHAAADWLSASLGWGEIKAGGSTKRGYVWVTSTL
jgi:hypothetical protein